jgi:hypothetical protein
VKQKLHYMVCHSNRKLETCVVMRIPTNGFLVLIGAHLFNLLCDVLLRRVGVTALPLNGTPALLTRSFVYCDVPSSNPTCF